MGHSADCRLSDAEANVGQALCNLGNRDLSHRA